MRGRSVRISGGRSRCRFGVERPPANGLLSIRLSSATSGRIAISSAGTGRAWRRLRSRVPGRRVEFAVRGQCRLGFDRGGGIYGDGLPRACHGGAGVRCGCRAGDRSAAARAATQMAWASACGAACGEKIEEGHAVPRLASPSLTEPPRRIGRAACAGSAAAAVTASQPCVQAGDKAKGSAAQCRTRSMGHQEAPGWRPRTS